MTESSGANNYGSDQKKHDDQKEHHEKKASESFHEASLGCQEEIDRQAVDEVSRWYQEENCEEKSGQTLDQTPYRSQEENSS